MLSVALEKIFMSPVIKHWILNKLGISRLAKCISCSDRFTSSSPLLDAECLRCGKPGLFPLDGCFLAAAGFLRLRRNQPVHLGILDRKVVVVNLLLRD